MALTPLTTYKTIKASRKFKIKSIDNKEINLLARIAGSPINKKAGVYLYKHVGETVQKGENLLIIYSQSKLYLKEALTFYRENKIIS